MNSETSNKINNKPNKVESKNLSFNQRKVLVEGYLKIKQTKGNPNINNEKENKESSKENKESKTHQKNQDKKKEQKKDDINEFDIIDDAEIKSLKKTKNPDEEESNNNNLEIDLDSVLSKSVTEVVYREKINLWEIIAISNSIKKKAKNYFMKSIVSTIVYNGLAFKDKLSESTSKQPIIIYDKIENNYSKELLKKIQDSFIYMSYRSGLVNTKFLPGNKNDYTSDCGWGCMLRCSQMMLSRGFILQKLYDLKKSKESSEVNMKDIRKEILLLFYDKFIELEKIHLNNQIAEIYKKLLKDKIEVAELIPPYSIYILTLLGKCPNVFSSDHIMISIFLKINKTLFNEYIRLVHFKDSFIYKKKLVKSFFKKLETENDIQKENTNNIIEYNSEKYIFVKGGLIFISLRLGLHKIESLYVEMVPKLFNNLHNNIGFVSGKKKRAFYFIGIQGDKLIFADPHFNQKIERDEINFPSYSVNELYLMSIKELSSEITVGVGIFSKDDFEQFFMDLKWFGQICPGFIKYDE